LQLSDNIEEHIVLKFLCIDYIDIAVSILLGFSSVVLLLDCVAHVNLLYVFFIGLTLGGWHIYFLLFNGEDNEEFSEFALKET